MSHDSLFAFSGTIAAAAVSMLWMLMHCTLLSGSSQATATRSEKRMVLQPKNKQAGCMGSGRAAGVRAMSAWNSPDGTQ
ncbi:MAG: hypothetical protein KDB01_00365 [Planctomycetaceae bacterium]|nr:hypothetical protein [Planctomycetaceae bacterium]